MRLDLVLHKSQHHLNSLILKTAFHRNQPLPAFHPSIVHILWRILPITTKFVRNRVLYISMGYINSNLILALVERRSSSLCSLFPVKYMDIGTNGSSIYFDAMHYLKRCFNPKSNLCALHVKFWGFLKGELNIPAFSAAVAVGECPT